MTGDTQANKNEAKQVNVDRSRLTEESIWTVVDSEGEARLYQEQPEDEMMAGGAILHNGEVFDLSVTVLQGTPSTDSKVIGATMKAVSSDEEHRFDSIEDIEKTHSNAVPVMLLS